MASTNGLVVDVDGLAANIDDLVVGDQVGVRGRHVGTLRLA